MTNILEVAAARREHVRAELKRINEFLKLGESLTAGGGTVKPRPQALPENLFDVSDDEPISASA